MQRELGWFGQGRERLRLELGQGTVGKSLVVLRDVAGDGRSLSHINRSSCSHAGRGRKDEGGVDHHEEDESSKIQYNLEAKDGPACDDICQGGRGKTRHNTAVMLWQRRSICRHRILSSREAHLLGLLLLLVASGKSSSSRLMALRHWVPRLLEQVALGPGCSEPLKIDRLAVVSASAQACKHEHVVCLGLHPPARVDKSSMPSRAVPAASHSQDGRWISCQIHACDWMIHDFCPTFCQP